ncbi:MAG: hypothetical protein RLY16_1515 [Bacteroidota bacterium]
MKRFSIILGFSFLFFSKVSAQTETGSTLTAADSAQILNDMMQLLDSLEEGESFFMTSLSAGNRLFSVRNNYLNAQQNTNRTLVINPTLSYVHKSGFNLAISGSFLKEPLKSFGPTQWTTTVGYDKDLSKYFKGGVSYSHYFVKDHFSPYVSPVQNDWYGYLNYRKGWAQPGIALGYSTGYFGDYRYRDTVINGNFRHFYDSAKNDLKTFNVTLSVAKSFEWEEVFSKKDGIVLYTGLLLNMGSSKTNITHRTNAPLLLNLLNKRGRLKKQLTSSFGAESLGMTIDLNYVIGNFSIEPILYMDYYLKDTDGTKFSQVFTFTVGYVF